MNVIHNICLHTIWNDMSMSWMAVCHQEFTRWVFRIFIRISTSCINKFPPTIVMLLSICLCLLIMRYKPCLEETRISRCLFIKIMSQIGKILCLRIREMKICLRSSDLPMSKSIIIFECITLTLNMSFCLNIYIGNITTVIKCMELNNQICSTVLCKCYGF